MDTILILDPDPEHASALERTLAGLSCRPIVCRQSREALAILRHRAVDVIVLVATANDEWRTCMESLTAATRQNANPPAMACVIRGPYDGPSEKLYGARRGIRVIYEQY